MNAKIKEIDVDGEIYHVLDLEKPEIQLGDFAPAGKILADLWVLN